MRKLSKSQRRKQCVDQVAVILELEGRILDLQRERYRARLHMLDLMRSDHDRAQTSSFSQAEEAIDDKKHGKTTFARSSVPARRSSSLTRPLVRRKGRRRHLPVRQR